MARDIETMIDIHAPVADIWRILIDLPRYPMMESPGSTGIWLSYGRETIGRRCAFAWTPADVFLSYSHRAAP